MKVKEWILSCYKDTLYDYHRCLVLEEGVAAPMHATRVDAATTSQELYRWEKKGYVTKIYIIVASTASFVFFMWVPSIKRNLTFVQLVVTSVVCSDSVAFLYTTRRMNIRAWDYEVSRPCCRAIDDHEARQHRAVPFFFLRVAPAHLHSS